MTVPSPEQVNLDSLDLPRMVDKIVAKNFENSELPSRSDAILRRLINVLRTQIHSPSFLIEFGLTPQIVFQDTKNPIYQDNLSKLQEFRTLLKSRISGRSVEHINEEQAGFDELTKYKLY
jgi:hypothetical protein